VKLLRLLVLTFLNTALAACATNGQQTTSSADAQKSGGRSAGKKQLDFRLTSGLYRCEHGQSVEVERRSTNDRLIELRWQGRQHTLQRQASSSGLPRYEDRQSGLLWIDLPWKSVLMDANTGRPLANECKAAQDKTANS